MDYAKPPIVEAVLELRLREPIDINTVEKIAGKFTTAYPVAENEVTLKVEFSGDGGTSKRAPELTGKKLSTLDRTDIVAVRTSAFACIRLAPYSGWDEFVARAADGWTKFCSVAGRQVVSRIGVRNINRIDIPQPRSAAQPTLRIQDYLNCYVLSPDLSWGPMSDYVIQMRRPYEQDTLHVNLISGTAESPLVGFRSLLLDIDLSADNLSLVRDEDIWALVHQMHKHKNDIFEACITEKARELFNVR